MEESSAMRQEWTEVIAGSGVHINQYVFKKFGPANALLLEYKERHCAILSPPPNPDPSLLEYAKLKGDVDTLIISNLGHTAGYREWLEIFPHAQLYASSDCISLLKRLKPEDEFHPVSDIECQVGFECFEAPGTRTGSVLVRSTLGARSVVFIDEVLINLQEPIKPFFMKILFSITGTRTGLGFNNVFRLFLTSDLRKLADTILIQLKDNPICIPAHGDLIIDTEVLQQARALLA